MKADTDKPSILVSFASLTRFKASPECYRDWVLDSGAYSVLTSGRKIDLSEYIEVCKRLQVGRDSSKLVEVFALDVIGDPERSARNVEIMVREGVRAIPTFHFGSQWSYLEELARKYEKIALGGLVARGAGGHGTRLSCKMKLKWLEQCFARIWPKWIHGFGCCDRRLLKRLPFVSVDSTTWFYVPCRYGAIQFGGSYYDPKNSRISKLLPSAGENPIAFASGVRIQIQWHLNLEQEVRSKFGRTLEMARLPRFCLRLGVLSNELDYWGGLKDNQRPTIIDR